MYGVPGMLRTERLKHGYLGAKRDQRRCRFLCTSLHYCDHDFGALPCSTATVTFIALRCTTVPVISCTSMHYYDLDIPRSEFLPCTSLRLLELTCTSVCWVFLAPPCTRLPALPCTAFLALPALVPCTSLFCFIAPACTATALESEVQKALSWLMLRGLVCSRMQQASVEESGRDSTIA